VVRKDKIMLLLTRKRAGGLPSSKRCLPLWPMILFFSVLAAVLFYNNPKVSAGLSGEGMPKVSFEVKDTPLKVLIEEHLDSTGYTVSGCEKWDDVRVTLKVHGAPLDEALSSILKRAGITSYVMRIDESDRRITLRRLYKSGVSMIRSGDTGRGGLLSKEGQSDFIPPPEIKEVLVPQDHEKLLDMEAVPPSEPGGNGLTVRQLQSDPVNAKDLLDMEAAPPDKPGGRGLTVRELQSQPVDAQDPLDMEVVPPNEPGGRGLTVRELQSQPVDTQDPLDMEVVPPNEPGEKGLKLRELKGISE
jgi:hypothetical protein